MLGWDIHLGRSARGCCVKTVQWGGGEEGPDSPKQLTLQASLSRRHSPCDTTPGPDPFQVPAWQHSALPGPELGALQGGSRRNLPAFAVHTPSRCLQQCAAHDRNHHDCSMRELTWTVEHSETRWIRGRATVYSAMQGSLIRPRGNLRHEPAAGAFPAQRRPEFGPKHAARPWFGRPKRKHPSATTPRKVTVHGTYHLV